MFAIRRRWHRVAYGMGVIVSQHLGTAVSRRAVRRQEGGRIDLEVARRVSGDIGGGDRPFYAILPARQNAATLLGVGLVRFFTQSCDHVTCHFNIHPQILQAMGASENIIQGFIGSEGGRLDRALADASGLSRERIKALMSEGRILLAGKPVSQASLKVAGGTAFAIDVPEAAPAEAVAQDIPLNVVFEDEYLIIVDKPAGLVVHPAAGNLDGTLVNALLHHCRGELSGIGGVARPGIVHRIDKDTSGLLVVAKTDKAHEGLAVQFADHSIARAYRAVVAPGQP